MKKLYILPLIGGLLLVLIVIKIVHQSKKEKTVNTKPVIQAVQAECMIAKDTLIDFTFKAVGNTRANERVDLVSEVSLRLVSIHFKEGGKVNKGDLLFQLDDSELLANLKRVNAKLDLASETEKRNKVLLASGGISQQAYDESVSTRKVLEADKEFLNVQISKTKITAPFTGVIGIRNVSEGAYLTPGMILTILEDLSRLKLDFTVSEAYAPLIQKGKRINFRLDGIPGLFSAVIDAINPSISTSSGNLRVLAIIEKTDPRLMAGVAVSMTIESQSTIPSVYIPTQALIPTPGGYHIYRMMNGMAEYKSVLTGIRTETMVEIIQGIEAGDSILTTGFMKVRPNSRVKIIKVW